MKEHELLEDLRIIRGPNVWSDQHQKLLVAKLDLSQCEEGCVEYVSLWAEENLEMVSTASQKNDHLTFVASVVAAIIRHLQPNAEKLYAEALHRGESDWYAVVEYEEEKAGSQAAMYACTIAEALMKGEETMRFTEAKTHVASIYKKQFLGPSTSTIVNAAISRGIPVRRCPGDYIVFGQGAYQKKIAASISDDTGDISVDIAGDKAVTKEILQEALIPVPVGNVVRREEELHKLIDTIGAPLVVKPLNANQGKGITAGIFTQEDLLMAFKLAKTYARDVIVEQQIRGNDYRFLVIGNKLVAAAHRIPACVTGNGKSTIEQLVKEANADPRRGDGHGNVLTKITIDELTLKILEQHQLTPQSVPAEGTCVYLKDTANLSTGGTAIDVTDDVHPDNVLLAERIAGLVGLDICGIDIMAPDIRTPVAENGGAVLEVNAAPGLRMHVAPSHGKSRDIGDAVINLLYPEGSEWRVPIVAVTGTNGKTTTTRLMAGLAQKQGYRVGFTTTDGIYLKGRCIYKGDCSGAQSAALVLREPSVNFAVLECARGGIIRSGLAFDQCDIAIVTNVAADHLGLKNINTIEDLARVKATVPKSVSPEGYAVLNADDELVYAMKDELNCKIALFSLDQHAPRIIAHCSGGGVAAVLSPDKDIVILKGSENLVIENVMNIPVTMGGKADFMIANVLPVALAAYLMNFSIENIRYALVNLAASEEQIPGRLNYFNMNGIRVLVDYAHNPHGLKALGAYLKKLETFVTGIITAVGDRRDEDIRELGRVAGGIFHTIIIRFDKDTRGRSREEIASLLMEGIREVNPVLPCHVIPDSRDALIYAVEHSPKQAYVMISSDDTTETLDMVKQLTEQPEETL
jgi:cyanophycin synthetase